MPLTPGGSARTSWAFALALVFGCAASGLAQAPAPGAPPTSLSQDLPDADFMFAKPRATLGIRGAYVLPGEGSDLFDFVRDQLTVDKGAFRGPGFAFDVGVPVTSRVDIVVGADFSRGSVASEYREFVDNEELPIQQESTLKERGLTGSVRVLLTPRGQSIGRFAWVPARLTPYVGAGGGLLWWEFAQTGDFVDFQDLSVFPATFVSKGTSPSGHVFGGLDVQVYKRLLVSVEGRYLWASGTLGQDFIDFEPIDLSGFRTTIGINVLF